MDEDQYDEFGNYIGAELISEEEEESSSIQDIEKQDDNDNNVEMMSDDLEQNQVF